VSVRAAWVLVPETAMHENNLPPTGEDKVGIARQVFLVESITVSHRMYQPPHNHFREHPLAANAAH